MFDLFRGSILGVGFGRYPAAFRPKIILAEQVDVLPGNHRTVYHSIEKHLPARGILDLFQLLRQVEIVPADDAVFDEPLAGFRDLVQMMAERDITL